MKVLQLDDSAKSNLIKYLNKVDFLAGLNPLEFEKILLNFERRAYDDGEVIIERGGHDQAFFFVYQGKVMVRAKKFFFTPERVVAELGPGKLFGEIFLLEQLARTATVLAKGTCEVFVLESRSLPDFLKDNPTFREALIKISESRR